MGTIEEEMIGVFAIGTIAKFKTELRKRKDISQVPTHYEIGPRKLNIILTMLRCFASFLN
jgi:hypothetical protein